MSEEKEQWIVDLLKASDSETKMTEKQLKIMNAAIDIFSEKGYAASSTSEIAQKAGVAEGTIFRHYKTKKDLLISIIAPVMTKLIAPFILKDFYKIIDAPYTRYEDFLRAILMNRIEFLQKNLPVLKILLQEIPFHPELKEIYTAYVAEHVLVRFKKAMERFQKEGQIIDIPPLSAIRLSVSALIGFVFARYFLAPEGQWDDDYEIELTIQFIMHGLTPQRSS